MKLIDVESKKTLYKINIWPNKTGENAVSVVSSFGIRIKTWRGRIVKSTKGKSRGDNQPICKNNMYFKAIYDSTIKTYFMKKLIFGLISFLIIACSTKPKDQFQLNGKTNGIVNGTVLYLDNINTRILIDSAVVENNSFHFQTKLPKSPLQVVLRTKDLGHYRFLWLENNPMTFDASDSDFRNAIVTGSVEETRSYSLSKETDTLSRIERIKTEQQFVWEHPNSIHSAYVLSVYAPSWGKEKTK